MSRPLRTSSVAAVTPQAGQAFGVALGWLAVTALLGTLLRAFPWLPTEFLPYRHWLHAHSHLALLGWVFNACFALAVVHFLPMTVAREQGRLYLVLQVAVLGMLLSFPVQGYGTVSIAFSTLHLGAAAFFAWRLWHQARVPTFVLWPLRLALLWLVLSGLGPLALGPLAAADLREHPAYSLAIYFYLHGLYNGWFVFFLLALGLRLSSSTPTLPRVRSACLWLGAGTVLTLAQSALWLDPPGWVYALAALGGLAQWIGLAYLAGSVRQAWRHAKGLAGSLVRFALGAFALKLLLQLLAALPVCSAWVNHRFVVIAFLHLVFLGMMTPALLAAGLLRGWLPDTRLTRGAVALLLSGFVVSEILLISAALPLPWPLPPGWFPVGSLVAAGLMSPGAVALFLGWLNLRVSPQAGSVDNLNA